MEYKFLIEQNKEYQELYTKYNEILREKRKALVEINNQALEVLDLDKLEHNQLKELIDLMDYNVNSQLKENLNKVYLSKKPYTNKVVEEMDFLSKNKKIQLDVNLSYFKDRYITHAFWSKIALDESIKDKIIEVLLEHGLIRVDHRLCCPKCNSYLALLRKSDLDYINYFDRLKLKIKEYESNGEDSEELDELYDKYYDIEEGDNPLYRYCSECDNEAEFKNVNDVLEYCREIYYIL